MTTLLPLIAPLLLLQQVKDTTLARTLLVEYRFPPDSSTGPSVPLKHGVVYWAEVAGTGTLVVTTGQGKPAFIDPVREDSSLRQFRIYPPQSSAYELKLIYRDPPTVTIVRVYRDVSETERVQARRQEGPAIGVSVTAGRHTGLGIDSMGGADPRGGSDLEACVLLESGNRFGTCAGVARETFPDPGLVVGWVFLEERVRLLRWSLFAERNSDLGVALRVEKAMGVDARAVYPSMVEYGVQFTQKLAPPGQRRGVSLLWSWRRTRLSAAPGSRDVSSDRFSAGLVWLP